MDVMNELFNDLQRVQHEETITPKEEEVGWTDQPVVVVSPHEKPQEAEKFVDPAILPLQETKEQEAYANRIEPVPKPAEEKLTEAFVEWIETPEASQFLDTLTSFNRRAKPKAQDLFYRPLFPKTTGSLIPPSLSPIPIIVSKVLVEDYRYLVSSHGRISSIYSLLMLL